MLRISILSFAMLFAVLASSQAPQDEEPQTLMSRLAEWQYPGSKFNGATMKDAATLNKKGMRSAASMQCHAVLTTADPIEKVVEYYKSKLVQVVEPKNPKGEKKSEDNSTRAVTFHEDSENRPLAVQIIMVNEGTTSTTLVISRADTESETHIAWSQYSRL